MDLVNVREHNEESVLTAIAILFFILAELSKRTGTPGTAVFYALSLGIALFALYTKGNLATQVVITAVLIVAVIIYYPKVVEVVTAEKPCGEAGGICAAACGQGFSEDGTYACGQGLTCCVPAG
ncbi:hypothetical protein JXA12_04980 [Candidatus Woesearchaeota archaeon]|nr:hypothetical protein [Candidatus Woesearchaeota archaeon]